MRDREIRDKGKYFFLGFGYIYLHANGLVTGYGTLFMDLNNINHNKVAVLVIIRVFRQFLITALKEWPRT